MTLIADRLLVSLSEVACEGAARAGRALTGLMGQRMLIHVPSVRLGTQADTCGALGGDEAIVLGAYLSISGEITGHVMLLFPEARALECVEFMTGQAPGTAHAGGELELSAIGELTNIVGSAFVNALGDRTGLVVQPSPPTICHDMAVALVQSIYAEVLSQDGDVVMIDAVFEDRKGRTAGLLIVAPDPPSLATIAGCLG